MTQQTYGIRFLNHVEIDKYQWDDCVVNSQFPIVYAKSWYLDIVSPEWQALVFGNYEAVMPLTQRKKLGIYYLFQPDFCQQLGIFYRSGQKRDNLEEIFLQKAKKHFSFIEINLNSTNLDIEKKVVTTNTNYELKLNKSYDELYKGFSDNVRRNIKKAKKNELVVHSSEQSFAELIKLFRENKSKEVGNFSTSYYETLKNIHLSANQNNAQSYLISAFNPKKEIIAGALFLVSDNRAIFLFSSNSKAGKETGAMHFIIDSFIKKYANPDLLLDFEGSNNATLGRFYKSFGATVSYYPRLRINNLPPVVKWLKR